MPVTARWMRCWMPCPTDRCDLGQLAAVRLRRGEDPWANGPVTRRFTRASGTLEPENGLVWGFKTLFRPQRFDYFGVHRPRFHKTPGDCR